MDFARRRRRALLTAACTAALASAAHAAEAPRDVQEVVVTGGLEATIPQELARYGSRLTVVDGETIDRIGYVDVGQALSTMVPGLYLAPQSGAFSYNASSFQGSRSGEVLYLVDGVRISNRLYNTTPPLDTIPAHRVQRIEVLEGGQGLFYGTTAVAGVVNIVTRDFTTETHGRVEAGGDTNRTGTASGYISGAIGKHRLVAYASHDQSRGFDPFFDGERQPSATDTRRGYRLASAGLKYAYDFSDDLRFSASYQHTEGFVDSIRPVDAARAVNTRDEEIATAKLDWTVSDQLQLFVKGYWHDWGSHYDEVDNVAGGGTDHVDDNEFWGFWDYGLNAVAKFTPTAGLETFVGYDVQKYWGRDDVLIIADQTETTQAVFGQVRVTPELLPRTHLAAGVRYNAPDEGDGATVWNLSGQYDLTDTLFARTSFGTSFRLPDAESLFANDPIFNGEIGNPDLQPEKSRNFNASVGWTGAHWQGELIGFWRETKDLISLEGETPDPDVFTFINLPDKVTAKGFEAVVRAELGADWELSGSYTHAQARTDGSSDQLATVPEDIAQGGLDWRPDGRPYGASLIGSWVGSVADNVSSGFGRQEHGHYTVVDLSGYLTFGPGDRHRLSARLENLFDETYATRVTRAFNDVTGDPYLVHYRGAPRTLHVSYAYSF
jgi:vitamin B12 transporter